MSVIKSKLPIIICICSFFIFFNCTSKVKSTNEVILEVSVDTSGQVTFQGEKLLLRVFDNGDGEADILASRTQKETTFQKNKFSLSENDFNEIQHLLKLIESPDVKKKYLPNAPSSDLYSITKINFTDTNKQKIEIVLEEYGTDVLLDEYGQKYPKPIFDLLKVIYRVRHSNSGRQ